MTSPFLRCIETAYVTAVYIHYFWGKGIPVDISYPVVNEWITEMPWELPSNPRKVKEVWTNLEEKVKQSFITFLRSNDPKLDIDLADLAIQFQDNMEDPDLTLLFSHKGRINLYEGMGTCRRYSCIHKATYRAVKALGLATGVGLSAAALRQLVKKKRQRAAARADA